VFIAESSTFFFFLLFIGEMAESASQNSPLNFSCTILVELKLGQDEPTTLTLVPGLILPL
jgi:hypothetical protein